MEIKLKKIDDQVGIILPQDIVNELKLEEGDILKIERRGSLLAIKPPDHEFKEWAEAYRHANIDYKDVLKKLGND